MAKNGLQELGTALVRDRGTEVAGQEPDDADIDDDIDYVDYGDDANIADIGDVDDVDDIVDADIDDDGDDDDDADIDGDGDDIVDADNTDLSTMVSMVLGSTSWSKEAWVTIMVILMKIMVE